MQANAKQLLDKMSVEEGKRPLPCVELVVQLVEVSEVEAAVEGPHTGSQEARLSLDDVCVAEEGVQHLPDQDHWQENQVGQAHPEDVLGQPARGEVPPTSPCRPPQKEVPTRGTLPQMPKTGRWQSL